MRLSVPRFLCSIVTVIAAAVAIQVHAQEEPLTIVASTTIIADVARHVAGDLASVSSLLPVEADPHTYQPTPSDVARLAEADLLLVNGVGYERFLEPLLESAGDVPLVVVSNGIEILAAGRDGAGEGEAETVPLGILGETVTCEAGQDDSAPADAEGETADGFCDPHVWMNPENVAIWVANMADAFAAADPERAGEYRANADAYLAELEALDAEIEAILSVVPDERRVLVTYHEFMAYFAAAYGFDVLGTVLPDVTTGAETDPRALARLTEAIEAAGVPAIFAETSANPQLAEIVAAETGIPVVTTLYSESLSETDGPAGTYIDLMRANARAIAGALAP